LGGTPFEIRGVDLYTLRDGKASEGVSYFDPRPLLRDEPAAAEGGGRERL
jgi:hypothetical protein